MSVTKVSTDAFAKRSIYSGMESFVWPYELELLQEIQNAHKQTDLGILAGLLSEQLDREEKNSAERKASNSKIADGSDANGDSVQWSDGTAWKRVTITKLEVRNNGGRKTARLEITNVPPEFRAGWFTNFTSAALRGESSAPPRTDTISALRLYTDGYTPPSFPDLPAPKGQYEDIYFSPWQDAWNRRTIMPEFSAKAEKDGKPVLLQLRVMVTHLAVERGEVYCLVRRQSSNETAIEGWFSGINRVLFGRVNSPSNLPVQPQPTSNSAEAKTETVNLEKNWTKSFPTFLKEFAIVIGDKPETLPRGAFGILVAQNDKSEDIWMIPQFYPFRPGAQLGEAKTTSKFKGQIIQWNLTVSKVVDDPKTGDVVIEFKPPNLANYHPLLKVCNYLNAKVQPPDRNNSRTLVAGQKVNIEAEIGFNMFEGLDVFVGVGPNEGVFGMGLSLRDAKLLNTLTKGDRSSANTTVTGKNGMATGNSPKTTQNAPSTSKNWPKYSGELNGGMEVRVKNPNEFGVKVGLRSAGKGKDFVVDANGIQSVRVPNGRYDIYFQYSTDPDGLYQGDSFTLNDNGVEIQIVKVVNGNYGIRKVK
jgi:hypothetical protein